MEWKEKHITFLTQENIDLEKILDVLKNGSEEIEENEDKIRKITRLNEYDFSTDDINWLEYKKKIEKRLKNF